MAKETVSKERIGRYTHTIVTKNGIQTHYINDRFKGSKGKLLGDGINGSALKEGVNIFSQLIFEDIAPSSSKGMRALDDLEPELFTLDVVRGIVDLAREKDPDSKDAEINKYIEAVMRKNPELAKNMPEAEDEKVEPEEVEETAEPTEEIDEKADNLIGEVLAVYGDYKFKVVEDETSHEFTYIIEDEKTNTRIGNGVADDGISSASAADVIFAATKPGNEGSAETMVALRPELFTEEVMGDLLRIAHDKLASSSKETQTYIEAILAKNPEVAKAFDVTIQPAQQDVVDEEAAEETVDESEKITDGEELAGYVHRTIEKDGIVMHYLYDKVNDKILGEGIDDKSLPKDVHPIAALLSHDVATSDNGGKAAIKTLRPELFSKEITDHLISFAEQLYSRVEPTVENTESYNEYLGLIGERHDLYRKALEQEENKDAEEEVEEIELIQTDSDSESSDEKEDVVVIIPTELPEGATEIESLAGYSHIMIEKDGVKTHYLYDTVNKTNVGNGIEDKDFDNEGNGFADLIFKGLGETSDSALAEINKLRNELFTDEVTRALIARNLQLTLKTDPSKEAIAKLSSYTKTVSAKFSRNPDKQLLPKTLEEKPISNIDSIEKDATVEPKEIQGRYIHRVITKDGVTRHYLFDSKTKNYLGNGIEDKNFDEKANPFAELMFKDVARMSKNGIYNAEVLGKELFTPEVVAEMIKSAEASGRKQEEIAEYVKLLTDRRDGVERPPVTPPEDTKGTNRKVPKENGEYKLATIGSYSHVVVVKDGVATHFLHDDKEDKYLGNGIDDKTFNYEENEFAVLLTEDVAGISPDGISEMKNLRNDLFEKEVVHGLVKISTESLLIKKPPTSKNANLASAYNLAAAGKYDERAKGNTNDEERTSDDENELN